MKNRFLNIGFFIGLSLFTVSCDTSEKKFSKKANSPKVEPSKHSIDPVSNPRVGVLNQRDLALRVNEKTRNTLRINFEENILTLNPRAIASQSEEFVGFLLYEGLYNLNNEGKTMPLLIKRCFLDTLSNTFFFQIKSSIAFQNGEILNSSHIYTRFKEIIDLVEESSIAEIKKFRNEIKGYKKYSIRKLYNIGNDSLPEGFKIIDDINFSIQFTKPQPDLFTLLAKPYFWIYQTTLDDKYIGTGPYHLSHANEDISYTLSKNKKYHDTWEQGLDNINIRFIKNKDAQLHEFLNGSLDLLIQKPTDSNDRLNNQYANYRKIDGRKALVKHFSLMNFRNVYMKNLVLQLGFPDKKNSIISINKDKSAFKKHNLSKDSISVYIEQLHYTDSMPKVRIPIIISCNQNYNQEFDSIKSRLSTYFELYKVSMSEINPNAPYIVIEESEVDIYTSKPNNNTLLELAKQYDSYTNSEQSITIMSYKREAIYTNIMLKGLSPYTDWTKKLDKLYFTEPKVY